jgi:hypothetical protein
MEGEIVGYEKALKDIELEMLNLNPNSKTFLEMEKFINFLK